MRTAIAAAIALTLSCSAASAAITQVSNSSRAP
jgi:hypothetical protein